MQTQHSDEIMPYLASGMQHSSGFNVCQSTCLLQSMVSYWDKQSYCKAQYITTSTFTGPRSAVGNVSGYRCEADCRSRGREFDPGPVPYFRGDWSWNNFYGHSPLFRWMNHSWRVVVSYKRKYMHDYWLTACSSLPRKKVWLGELTVPQWP